MLPAHMAGGICADNCIGMQLFALDFDDTEARFEDIRERSEAYNLPISFSYDKYNSKEDCEIFRVVSAFPCEQAEIHIKDYLS